MGVACILAVIHPHRRTRKKDAILNDDLQEPGGSGDPAGVAAPHGAGGASTGQGGDGHPAALEGVQGAPVGGIHAEPGVERDQRGTPPKPLTLNPKP
eukprot:1181017-Prorocentrum_minimum.AAC.1